MSLQRIQTNKEFSRDVVVGVVTIVSLFGILLFVAVERFTGRSISPLSYLYAKPDKKSKSRPVKVFASEADRLAARAATKNQPSFDLVAKKLKQITESLKKNSNDSQDESVQLASHEDVVPEKNDTTNQFIANKSYPAPPSNSSFQAPIQPTNSSSFSPTPFNPNPSSEIPSTFQPASSETTNQQTTRPPSTTPSVTHPVVVNPFRNETQVTRFQSPESEVTNNPISQSTNKTDVQSGAIDAPPTNPNFAASNSFSPPNSIPTESKHLNRSPTEFTNESADKSGVAIDTSEPAPSPTISDKRIQPLKDDSFWTIASREYGNGKLFRQLAAYNRCIENSDIMPRTVLIPDLKKLQSVKVIISSDNSNLETEQPIKTTNAGSQQESKYVVKKEDTLFDVAKQELGQAVRFVEIIRLNQEVLPTNVNGETELQAGTELVLPK